VAEDINNYSFDFAKEVTKIRQELGTSIVVASFVEVSADKTEILQFMGPEQLKQMVSNDIKRNYDENPDLGSFRHRVSPIFSFGDYISFVNNGPTSKMFGEENKETVQLFVLYHETAHLLISEGAPINNECAADAYAAIRLLQRFGDEVAPLLSMWSWLRAESVLYSDMNHLSTLTLDRIVADAASGSFSGLTASQTVDYAVSYSRATVPTPRMLKGVRKAFKNMAANDTKSPDNAPLILEAGLNSKSQLARYLAAKFYTPFLHKNGIEFYEELASYDAGTQNRYQALIDSHTAAEQIPQVARCLGQKPAGHLRRMFNKLAKKPAGKTSLAKFLQVSVPTGQQRITFDYK
jgi:hypothetical protein